MTNSGKAKRRRITFNISARPGSTVRLAGSFNNWTPDKKLMAKGGADRYSGTLLLEPGQYEYKFVVDDVWCIDPENTEFVRNDYGTLNSVLIVK
jgi:1,4-alpha-glucan branching enzyme